MSRHATPRHATPRHATPRHATPRHATPRHATPRHATPRHATPRHATPRHATPRHATPRHATRHATPRHVTPRHVMSCHAFARRSMLHSLAASRGMWQVLLGNLVAWSNLCPERRSQKPSSSVWCSGSWVSCVEAQPPRCSSQLGAVRSLHLSSETFDLRPPATA